MPSTLSIAFQGAARTVTGSRHRVRFGEHSWLFDCGLYQGHRDEAEHVNRTFAFDPAELDSVVISHAHLDHSGNLPTLVSQGYRGRIHMTPATSELCKFMLEDSAFLQERDLAHLRKHHPDKDRAPLYTQADVEQTLTRFESHGYHQTWALFPGVRAITTISSATGPFVIHNFSPFRIQALPSAAGVAVVVMRAGSEPTSTSVSANAEIASPFQSASTLSRRYFCTMS